MEVYIINNLIGKRFHNLVVNSFVEKRNGKPYWLCKCDCGKEKLYASITLQVELHIVTDVKNANKLLI